MTLPAATHLTPSWVCGQPAQRLMVILRAPGCVFDRQGCNFCGFRPLTTGGRPVTTAEYLAQMTAALAGHQTDPRIREIDIYNSGNFLNDAEVPPGARTAIFRLCAAVPSVRRILAESRPEFVRREAVMPLLDAVHAEVDIAIGLEAFDDQIRQRRLEKAFDRAAFERAVRTLGQAGAGLLAYIMLKPCAMSDAAALDDATQAAEYVHSLRAPRARLALQPAFVAPGTPLADEYRAGRYRPPSLWLVRQAAAQLARFGEVTAGLWDEDLAPLAVPDSCPACRPRLLTALRQFNLTQDANCLEVEACPCSRISNASHAGTA
jgi:radical SAM enzyme (TIGR01210 family)